MISLKYQETVENPRKLCVLWILMKTAHVTIMNVSNYDLRSTINGQFYLLNLLQLTYILALGFSFFRNDVEWIRNHG